jgi:UDP-2,3-diacylglucosamine hydrolase
MKVSAISDVHVKNPHDPADKLLCTFLKHPLVRSSNYVALLGDIFDLMCGPHDEYLEKFSHIFDLMHELSQTGVRVMFFEGNHDVHLEQLFKKRWPEPKIKLSQTALVEMIEGKTYYFSHGDEHEIDNLSYQKYKKIILSPPLKFVANHLMPYKLLHFLGERASKLSRKKGSREYVEDVVREKFRLGVKKTTKGDFNFVLGGHSHVKDVFKINQESMYLNNGYAIKSKTFLLIENHKVSFPELV